MASPTTLVAVGDVEADRERALDAAETAVAMVATTCSRFDPASDLSRLNAQAELPTMVSPTAHAVISAALSAYRRTIGRFDPRVIGDLERFGYDRSFERIEGRELAVAEPAAARGEWRPLLGTTEPSVDLRGERIDLGGIAKGFAADLAADELVLRGLGGLIDLGGDGRVVGVDEDGETFRIGIEDPQGSSEPLAVFGLLEGAYATSSTRLRSWKIGSTPVHHLIDPSTGRPGGGGMLSVTVIGERAAAAEVDAKVAFLVGRSAIADHVARQGLAALWVDVDGVVGYSPSFARHLVWMRP